MAKVVFYKGFLKKRADIKSQRIRSKVDAMLHTMAQMPGVGSSLVTEGMRWRYGDGVLKAVVRPYLILYEYDRANDVVYVYDLATSSSLF